MFKTVVILLFLLFISAEVYSQQFKTIPLDIISGSRPLRFGDILITSRGLVLVASSMEICELDGTQIIIASSNSGVVDDKGNSTYLGKNSNIFKDYFELHAGIKLLYEGPDKIIYVVSYNNNFGWINYKAGKAIGVAPFNYKPDGEESITKIFIDKAGTLFAATNSDSAYMIENAAKIYKINTEDKKLTYDIGLDKDSNFVVLKGARIVKKFSLGKGVIPYSFAEDTQDERILLIGTNYGLYGYDKQTGESENYLKSVADSKFTISNIEVDKWGINYWFSTLEKGMVRFNTFSNSLRFYVYPKKQKSQNSTYPIQTFYRKSASEFFVAIADSLPAIFNTESGRYSFIDDSIFYKTANKTSDIKTDVLGNLYITKGGGFYFSRSWLQNNFTTGEIDSSLFGPYITEILLNKVSYGTKKYFHGDIETLKEISLSYDESDILINYSSRGIAADSLIFAWKLDNYRDDWILVPYSVFGAPLASISHLEPGRYIFRVKAKKVKSEWLAKQVELVINVSSPYWRTWWFWISIVAGVLAVVFLFVKWRVAVVRREEREKVQHSKELLELEAKALRAQMNPHFIFNCMNSIKSIIQKDKKDEAITYLVTFSKLIRTIFQIQIKEKLPYLTKLKPAGYILNWKAYGLDPSYHSLFRLMNVST